MGAARTHCTVNPRLQGRQSHDRYVFRAITGTSPLQKALRRHFGRVALGQVATAAREFPVTSRVDLQAALEDMFRSRADARLLGIFSPNFHESPTLAQVFAGGPFMMNIGPLQHDEMRSTLVNA
jgi:hypothetical protein